MVKHNEVVEAAHEAVAFIDGTARKGGGGPRNNDGQRSQLEQRAQPNHAERDSEQAAAEPHATVVAPLRAV